MEVGRERLVGLFDRREDLFETMVFRTIGVLEGRLLSKPLWIYLIELVESPGDDFHHFCRRMIAGCFIPVPVMDKCLDVSHGEA